MDEFVWNCIRLLCAVPLNASLVNQMKGLLVSNMETDYYWEKAWKKLSEKPDDHETKEVLEIRMRMFFAKLFSLPEYQMM